MPHNNEDWTPGIDAMVQLRQIAATRKSSWAVSAVRAAQACHERGEFRESAVLASRMTRDARIKSALEMRVAALLSLPFQMTPAGASERQVEVAEKVALYWKKYVSTGVMKNILQSWHMNGFSLVQLVWQFDDELQMMVPSLEQWDPEFVRRDENTREWEAMSADGWIPINIKTGYSNSQSNVTGKWILLTAGTDGFMDAATRTLGLPWIERDIAWESWMTLNERHGMPFIKVKVPASAKSGDKESLFNSAKFLSEQGAAMLPQNVDGEGGSFDLEFEEIQAQAWQTHERLIAALDQDIAIFFLGQNLTTDITGGSFAAADVHLQVLQAKIEADARVVESVMKDQLIRSIVRINFANPSNMRLVPCPVWDAEKNTVRLADLNSLASAIGSLKTNGFDIVNVEELAARMGIVISKRSE